MTRNPKSIQNNLSHIPRPVLIATGIALLAFLMGMGTWLLYTRGNSNNQQKGIGITITGQKAATPTPIQIQVPPIPANTPVSPLLFGTNMGLFDSNDQVLNSTVTRAALQQIHMRIIRMPTRSSLAEATEIQAAQTIKSLGAAPLVILRGQLDKNVLADDMRIVKDMNTIFGQNIVYYEYGNEEDLQGVPVNQYTASWNSIIPQLKHIALHANFIGPVNFQYDHNYLTTFLQSAQPRPDEISWHEYTCDDSWATSVCISHIDHWTNHIADARATMISTVGSELPIMITEWNYAPNAVPNDGKNNNSAFMNAWTTHALQTLAANRIFASMQYSCTNTAIPLVSTDGTITTQGTMLQSQYQNIIINGKLPAPPTNANPVSVATTTTSGTTTNGTKGFTFADGGTDGWSAHSSALTLQNSPAPGLNGKHALHVAIGPLTNSDYPSITVDTTGLSSYPQAGQTLSANVYIASNSVSIAAKVFVTDSNDQWHSSSMTTLTPGTWVHLTYTLPGDINGSPKQIGIQFNSPGGSTISSDVYIDAVNWG
jgi:hypothetical protein